MDLLRFEQAFSFSRNNFVNILYFVLQELQKSRQLEESMRKLDVEMKRTDELLYQMIPKQVADRLRRGEAAVDTCQVIFFTKSYPRYFIKVLQEAVIFL